MDDSPHYRPLYRQVYDYLVKQIAEGAWRPAEALPSEQALAEKLHVSQGTVRKALDVLAVEKLIERRQGKGTYVAEHTQERALFRFFRLARPDGQRSVPTSADETVKRRAARAPEQRKLNLRDGAQVVEINRTRFVSGEPVVHEKIILPLALFPDIDRRKLPNALYALFQQEYGQNIVSTEEELRADVARKDDIRRLQLPLGAPLLHIERVAIALDGTRVEWRTSRCDTSKLVYAVTLSEIAMTAILCVGHAVQDYVFGLTELPHRAGKFRATGFQAVGGGPAATAAVTIARLGATAKLAARVGEDAAGGEIIEELQRYGVDCQDVRRMPGCSSSVSAVMVDARGERLIVNHRDARLPCDPSWLPDPQALQVDAVLADCRWEEGAAAALQQARAQGLLAILDADVPVPKNARFLQHATHVAFSADGLTDLTGDRELTRALRTVAAQLDAWCAVTAGAEGVFSIAAGKLEHHAAFSVPVVDTLGAGDVWHGALALALAEKQGERAAVRFASAAAAIKVQRFGGRAGVPTRKEVAELLATNSVSGSAIG